MIPTELAPLAATAAAEAIRDVADDPENEDAMGSLRLQILKILKEDAGLAADVAKLLAEHGAGGGMVVNVGARGVGAGGKMTGNVVVTGDGNTVGKG